MKENIAIIIGNNVGKLLYENNIYQRAFAKTLGVDESTVGKWILGKSVPRMGMIEKMSNYFGIEKSDILEDKRDSKPTNQPLECIELNNLCKKMNNLGMNMLIEYAKFILTKEEYKKEVIDNNPKKITA